MSIRSPHAVVLPGTGSDARFAADAFESALTAARISMQAVEPEPSGVVAGYKHALDAAAHVHGRIIVGGISIGAVVAVAWAIEHPDRVTGVLAALPPWLGDSLDAPAAASARITAQQLTEDGLAAVTEAMAASTPSWLAAALRRSWAAQWPNLPSALLEAAAYAAPDEPALRSLGAPTAIVGCVDDPVHPFAVAELWQRAVPRATLSTVTLDDIGADPSILGNLAVADLLSLIG
ncbi:alpha/beta hydrolase [Rhodococcus sp. G-MC3]|uniref:alpha/beta fold hydrolase n=1 Tax=Rhodococcus sp. G-MC3 TaxID=3046209 RepID=UPI0024B9ED4D|nr:alpha/beta hydrolase [Rhodococcus sp. G-MC3]MDJ0391724.1 alpha/beta hydrolase [Rhodococcus sp. G-MC3]